MSAPFSPIAIEGILVFDDGIVGQMPESITRRLAMPWVPKLYARAGSAFVAIKVNDTRYPMAIKLRDGAHIKNRFREALLGNTAFD